MKSTCKIKIFLSVITFALIMGSHAKGQDDLSIKIKDLIFMPSEKQSVDTSKTVFQLILKINKIESAKNLILKFGSARDLEDVFSSEATVIYANGDYQINIGQNLFSVKNYTISLNIELENSTRRKTKFITVFFESKQGTLSNKLYDKLN